MYAFLIERYKYSEDQAYRCCSAMRLLQELPEVEEKLNSGELSLSVLNAARTHFRNEEKHAQKEMAREEKIEVLENYVKKR